MSSYNIPTEASEKEIPIAVSGFSVWSGNTYSDTSDYCAIYKTKCSTKDDPDGDYTDYPACGRTICSYKASRTLCSAYEAGGYKCNDGENNFVESCRGLWGHTPHLMQHVGMPGAVPLINYIGGEVFNVEKARELLLVNKLAGYGMPWVANNANVMNCAADFSCPTTYCELNGIRAKRIGVGGYNVHMMSVRCTLARTSNFYYPASGGAGSAGAYSENIEIPQTVLDKCSEETSDCSIKFTIGTGGTKTNSVTSKTVTTPLVATNGTPTSVEVLNNSASLWKYTVLGGLGGKSSLYQVAGIGGEALDTSNSCEECLGSECTKIACTKTSDKGEDGVIGQKGFSIKAIPASKGALSALSPTKTYGNGGNGGYFTTSYQQATNGSPGYAKITYDGKAQGTSGGGGAGGAFVLAKSIPVSSSAQLPVQIGAAGLPSSSFPGHDGGDTVFSIYAAYGGKGGALGTPESDSTPSPVLGKGGQQGKVFPETLESIIKYESHSGSNGEDAKFSPDKLYSIGGSGGPSGISLSSQLTDLTLITSCPGFHNNNCYNSFSGQFTANGSFIEFKKPSKPYSTHDFGSAGHGGAGGSWKFDGVNTFIGSGGKGTDGYIFVWW